LKDQLHLFLVTQNEIASQILQKYIYYDYKVFNQICLKRHSVLLFS